MILMDVNMLVYAHREDTANHSAYRDWLEEQINGAEAYGVSELVLSGFIRVVTLWRRLIIVSDWWPIHQRRRGSRDGVVCLPARLALGRAFLLPRCGVGLE